MCNQGWVYQGKQNKSKTKIACDPSVVKNFIRVDDKNKQGNLLDKQEAEIDMSDKIRGSKMKREVHWEAKEISILSQNGCWEYKKKKNTSHWQIFLDQNYEILWLFYFFPIQNFPDHFPKVTRGRLFPDLEDKLVLFGPRQANLVLIAYGSSKGSGEPAHLRSLARTSAARSYKQWVKRNLQTESQISSPSDWLGMRS